MAMKNQLTKPAVLAAIGEFDKLGRNAFLAKYGFRGATTFLLRYNGRQYDAKAIVGAAHGQLPKPSQALTWDDFGSRENTTRSWLEQLGFDVYRRRHRSTISQPNASASLEIGATYTRMQLREIFRTTDATIMTGVFRVPRTRSVLLFVTEKKASDRTQYVDQLDGDDLAWQGQMSGRTDSLIIDHAEIDLELLVFYRRHKNEYAHGGFLYEGEFRYIKHSHERPASFLLRRVASAIDVRRVSEEDTRDYFDPRDISDARLKMLKEIVIRRGQPQFRKILLRTYGGQCAISGCKVEQILEAAHIYPYKGTRTHSCSNGILLRTDIHTLFDLGWIAVDPSTHIILVHPAILDSAYRALHGRAMSLPKSPGERPSAKALQWKLAQSRFLGGHAT